MARKKDSALRAIESQSLAPATIGFRLDEKSSRVLTERAARLGVSAHELARHYVIEMLHAGEERAALREVVTTLHQELN